jgi:hypothetical protein
MPTTAELVEEFKQKHQAIHCPMGTSKGASITEEACASRQVRSHYLRTWSKREALRGKSFRGVALDPCPEDCPRYDPKNAKANKAVVYGSRNWKPAAQRRNA